MSVNKQILHGVFINKPKLSAIMPKCECIYKKKKEAGSTTFGSTKNEKLMNKTE